MLRSIYLLSFLLLQSLFAFAGNVKENVPSSFDLYVCIGQSNMAGRATLTPEVMDTLQNVYLLNDKGNFEPAVNPLNRYSTVRKICQCSVWDRLTALLKRWPDKRNVLSDW